MKKTGVLLVFWCCLLSYLLPAQEVAKVVKAYPQGKAVMVEYDLGVDAELVRLFVSTDGGATYRGPLQHVTGDVAEVKAGFSRCIQWSVFDEFDVDTFEGDQVRFKINVLMEEHWPLETFATLNAAYGLAPQGSLGFSVGQARRYGWFVSVMTNGSLLGFHSDGVCNAQGYLPDGHLMQYTGETATMRLSVMVGGLVHLTEPLLARVGVGYGNRTLQWQTTDGLWYRNGDRSWQGLDLSAGLQLHFNGLVVSLEAVTTQFKYAEAKIGLGWRFRNREK